MKAGPPDWKQISDDLRALVTKGPVKLDKLSARYQALHGRPLDVGGKSVRACITKGDLRGLRYDGKEKLLKIDASNPRKKRPCPSHGRDTPPTAKGVPKSVTRPPRSTKPAANAKAEKVAPESATRPARSIKPAAEKLLKIGGSSRKKRSRPSHGHDTPPAAKKVAPGSATRPPRRIKPAKTNATPAAGVKASGFAAPRTEEGIVAGPGRVPRNTSLPSAAVTSQSSSTPSPSSRAHNPPYILIDSNRSCAQALATLSHNGASGATLQELNKGGLVTIQLDGANLGSSDGEISCVKISGQLFPAAVIIDVATLRRTKEGQAALLDQLCRLLEDHTTTKVVHDLTNSAIALRRQFGQGLNIRRTLDLQLAFEALHGSHGADILTILKASGQHETLADFTLSCGGTASTRRPMTTYALSASAKAVTSFSKGAQSIAMRLTGRRQLDTVLRASQLRSDFAIESMLQDTTRAVCRNHGSCWGGGTGRILMSMELKEARSMAQTAERDPSVPAKQRQPVEEAFPAGSNISMDHMGNTKKLGKTAMVGNDHNSPIEILKLIPKKFLQDHLSERHEKNLKDVIELVLDEGRRPYATLQGRGKLNLCNDETVVVTKAHIDKVAGRLDTEGRFGHDNRAGVPGQLHRLSVMRARKGGRIIGVTLRIGRYFPGSASIIDDLLFHVKDGPEKPERAASILIVGKPGSGKTTVLRDICRKVSKDQTVVVVDTSNEIAGDGEIPHLQAIGTSRRMMVPNKDGQHSVMIEALQNHTPQTIVVDEVSNRLEARACLDIKARGVRVVASAHGDLQSVLKNPELNSLVGGTTTVTLGDTLAQATNGGNKVQAQRAGAPIFDVIVEVGRGEVSAWSIVRNVDLAVDAILAGQPHQVEKRTCISRETSNLHQEAFDPEDATFLLKCVNEVEKTRQYY